MNAPSESKKEELSNKIIERLALLPDFEYELAHEKEAKILGIRVSALDKVVSKTKIQKHTPSDKFPIPDPWDEPVDMAQLLDDITKLINRFIICAPETTNAAALWIAFTWVIDNAQVSPIAFITAPEMQCGKSQLLNVMGKMVKKPAIASNISPSVVFRVIEKYCPTLLIDEADSFIKGNEELRGIINSGHTRQSAYVWRSVGDDHEPTQFSTWGAKALCGIGTQAATIMDRSIILELRRKLPHESVQRIRHTDQSEFLIICRKLARFAQDAGTVIAESRPALPENLSDRAQDNWEPLLAIADYAAGHWPHTARRAALTIHAKKNDDDNQSAGIMLLRDIQDIFDSEAWRDRITSAELIEKLCSLEDRPWNEWNKGKPITTHRVAKYLNPYGPAPQTIRNGSKTAKGYYKPDFEDAFARYLSDESVTTSQTIPDKPYKEKGNCNNVSRVTDASKVKHKDNKDCDNVTDDFEERAAIIEYDGGMSREEAEELARQEYQQCNT